MNIKHVTTCMYALTPELTQELVDLIGSEDVTVNISRSIPKYSELVDDTMYITPTDKLTYSRKNMLGKINFVPQTTLASLWKENLTAFTK